jgi:hypothetical protein
LTGKKTRHLIIGVVSTTGEIKMDKNYSAEEFSDEVKVIGMEDLGLDKLDIYIDIVYDGEKFTIEFQKTDPLYLTGDWVAQQEGREYQTDWGVADNDSSKEAYGELADRLVENEVITNPDEAYELLMNLVEPYLDGPDAELTAKMAANLAEYAKEAGVEQLFLADGVVMSGTELDTALQQDIAEYEYINSADITDQLEELNAIYAGYPAIDKDASGVWRIAEYEVSGGEELEPDQSMAADSYVAKMERESAVIPSQGAVLD